MNTHVCEEARRLWHMGFAILWIRPRAKNPVESGWTSGPRQDWESLEKSFKPGFNVGVRTGTPSLVGGKYLACIDVDIKDPAFRKAAVTAMKELTGARAFPEVRSGSGNGSRHLYCVTDKPFKMVTYVKEKEWEICIYSDGRQMVLPPSTHPSGSPYQWKVPIQDAWELPLLNIDAVKPRGTALSDKVSPTLDVSGVVLDGFTVRPLDLFLVDISAELRDGIETGLWVTDRSAFLLRASKALNAAGLSRDEILSVLTDPRYFLGHIGYEHAKTNNRKKAAEWVYRFTLQGVEQDRKTPETVFSETAEEAPRLTPEEQQKRQNEYDDIRPWMQDVTKNQHQIPHKTVDNVVKILQGAAGKLVVKRDTFAFRDTYGADTPWGRKCGSLISDDDLAIIKHYFGVHYKFEPNINLISEALIVIADQNAYDPVRDWLEGLPAWDGVTRLNDWLGKNFEAKGDLQYLAQVFRKWMVGMVLRIYQPGVKFDWMPIFEGAQDIGKSSFGRLLVGDKYFLDYLPNLGDKDAALSLQGMWGVEFGELTQFRKNELEIIKAFLSRTVDKVRPPYGRRVIEQPRRCVFFGTTNKETYLVDDTGNRRFKPVVVGTLNFEALLEDRIQLFAEAKYLLDTKKETERSISKLTGKAAEFEKRIHRQKMITDDSFAMQESMLDFIEKVQKGEIIFDLEKFRITDLFGVGGCLRNWRADNRNHQFCAKMLNRLGANKRVIRGLTFWKFPILEGSITPKEGEKDDF